MEKTQRTKELIMAETIDLIRASEGDTEQVTIRKIAQRCQISVGLINHHFGSKEKLIDACVQSIISGVISSFRPDLREDLSPLEQLSRVSNLVVDFLMDNPQISRISILGDLSAPAASDNTMGTARGFARRFSGPSPAPTDLLNAFMLTAILQESFLRKDVLKETLGIDFYDRAQRNRYIDFIVRKLFEGGAQWIEESV